MTPPAPSAASSGNPASIGPAPSYAVAARLAPFGTSVFAEMNVLAVAHQAVNLAQGFPDFDGPEPIKQAAIDAINAGHAQYARMIGVPPLNQALAEMWASRGHQAIDPDTWITVTTGCTQAIPSALLGLLNPGDEIILFEPFYDSYRACVSMAGAVPRIVPLHPPAPGAVGPDGAPAQFWFDERDLRAAFTPRTRAILLNTPHNPTGKVFTRSELELIASLCQAHGVVAIADEVYEHLTYERALPHVSIASIPGMRERTITLSSLGKTFSVTGWKIGWAIATPELTRCVRSAHQFLTFGAATPLQHAAASAIKSGAVHITPLVERFRENRDYLARALSEIGFGVHVPAGAYFVIADHARFGLGDDRAFCTHLVKQFGVAAIPPSAFYVDTSRAKNLARFAFCKRRETLEAAVARLRKLEPVS